MIFLELPVKYVFEDNHAYSAGLWIRDDVYKWLKEHVGKGNQSGSYVDGQAWMWCYSYSSGQAMNNCIGFNCPTDATLFKLTWL